MTVAAVWIPACAVLAAGCTLQTDVITNGYSRGDIDARLAAIEESFGFLGDTDCDEGAVPVPTATGWTCPTGRLCPPGFASTAQGSITVCTRTIGDANDVMVKVGDFWIDRYEMSLCGGELATGTGSDTTAIGCSVAGTAPTTQVTWFQAARMCGNGGKRLCTNAQWQVAAAGTPDPMTGSDGSLEECVTDAAAPLATGEAEQCESNVGAYDMIGNVAEWVDDWQEAGMAWIPDPATTATTTCPGPAHENVQDGPWPSGYENDATFNVNGNAYEPTSRSNTRRAYWASTRSILI